MITPRVNQYDVFLCGDDLLCPWFSFLEEGPTKMLFTNFCRSQ